MKKYLLILILLLHVLTVTSQQWLPDSNKKFALTSALGISLYAVSDTLYIGGHFLKIGTVNAFSIARYYNGRWDSLRGGLYGEPYSFLPKFLK